MKPSTIALTGLLALSLSHPAPADEKIYQSTLPATAWIAVKAEKSHRLGSGALIDVARKRVLTNYHVVLESAEAIVFFPCIRHGLLVTDRAFYYDQHNVGTLSRDGFLVSGKVIARDAKRDLALLEVDRLPAGARALVPAAAGPMPGQNIHSIGNPGAVPALWAYAGGRVKAVYQAQLTPPGFKMDARIVVADSSLNPGDSGGPAVNDRGELVALAQGHILEAHGCSLFIDVSEIKVFLARQEPAKEFREGASDASPSSNQGANR